MFRTLIDAGKSDKKSVSGDGYNNIYGLTKNGEVEIVGETCIYDQIQAFADECDIGKIIDRFNETGTLEFAQRAGEFMDITEMPDNLADALDIINKAHKTYDTNAELAKIFSGFDDFQLAIMNGSAQARIDGFYKKPENKEVKENEST